MAQPAPHMMQAAHQAQLHAQMSAAKATQQSMKWVIWIIVITTVAPVVLAFFFILLGMCAVAVQ